MNTLPETVLPEYSLSCFNAAEAATPPSSAAGYRFDSKKLQINELVS